MSKSHALHQDPLWLSFCQVLQFYQLPANPNLVLAQVPLDPEKKLTVGDLQRIARHMGFATTVRAMLPGDIAALTLPHLVVLADQTSLVWLPGSPGKLTAAQSAAPTTFPPDKVPLFAVSFERQEQAVATARKSAAWFWDLCWQYRRDYWDIALATLFINLFALVTSIYSMNVYDRVVPNHAIETLWALTTGVVLAFVFNFLFKLVRGHVLGRVTAQLAARLDKDLMERFLRLTGTGQALSVGERTDLFRELQGLRDFFAGRLIPALFDLPFFVMFLAVIFLIAPGLTPVVLIGILLMFLVSLLCRLPANRGADENAHELRGKNAMLVELIAGGGAIRLHNALGQQLHRWTRVAERSARSGERSNQLIGVMDELAMTIMMLVNVFIIVAGVYEIEQGALTVGGLVASSILVSRAMGPVMTLTSVLARLRQSLGALKLIDRVYSLPAEPSVPADYTSKAPFKGGVALKDVTFFHEGQVKPTLYHLNLSIAPGEKVGIIGRTGVGKSTITQILQGALTPQSGQTFVDGMALESIHPAEWRQHLGIVPQEPFMFSGTIRANILLGVTEAVDEAWLQEVLQLSGLDVLLQQAGYGLEYQIGEGGQRLSGGQKQAIALTRAMIRRPQIMLLDEPTNGMDHGLENHVRQSLQSFARGRTLVLVTHRTTLLGLVDRLVLIDGGKVTMDGPRDEILKQLAAGGAKPNV